MLGLFDKVNRNTSKAQDVNKKISAIQISCRSGQCCRSHLSNGLPQHTVQRGLFICMSKLCVWNASSSVWLWFYINLFQLVKPLLYDLNKCYFNG